MERKGVYFEGLFPHFYGGVQYQLPNGQFVEKFVEKFPLRREVIAPYLNERLRNYMESFGLKPQNYPYVNVGEKGITLHIGYGGEWIEIWRVLDNITSGHNLDGWRENAAAMNVGTDLLEYLSPEFLGPRVSHENSQWRLRYPLPDGILQINNKYFTEKGLEKAYRVAEFGKPKIENHDGLQKIVDSDARGEIIIQNGLCEGIGFQSWDVAKASFIISRIMILSDPNF